MILYLTFIGCSNSFKAYMALLDMWFALCLLILPTAVAFLFLKHLKKISDHQSSSNQIKLPPGELGLPWIGETIDFYKAQKKNQIYEGFVQPRILKHGKIFKTRLMGSPTVVVNGAEANKFFLTNEFKLVISSWPSSAVQLMGRDSIMEKQGEAHRCLRGLITSTLSCAGQELLVPKMCDTVQSHLATYWHNQDTISLYRLTKILTFTIVFECLLGVDEVRSGMFATFERVLEGVFALPFSVPGSKFSRAKSARKELHDVVVDVVRQKRKEITDNQDELLEKNNEKDRTTTTTTITLLWRLVVAMIGGEISEEEVVDNVVLLVFAAHDTTSFVIAMMFRMLAKHPECYSRLLQEHTEIRSKKMPGERLTFEETKKMSYTWQVARETMRMFPPIFGSFRKAVVDIDYEGFTIPRGWKVLWTAYGTHLDAEYFEEPHTFNPSRFEQAVQSYAFIPFGGGPRLCAGYQLARLNILVLLHYVVTQYDWSLLYPDEPLLMDPLPFPSQGMPIKISPTLQ